MHAPVRDDGTRPTGAAGPDAAEADRLAALWSLGILDSPPDEEFDAIVRAAALACGQPMAALSLVDEHRQWFKATVGMGDATETGRDIAICDHTIRQDDLFEVPNLAADPRFRSLPQVRGDMAMRFYAAMPLALEGGERIGALCVIGRDPAALTPTQREILRHLGRAAALALANWRGRRLQRDTAIALERRESALRSASRLLDETGRMAGVGGWEIDLDADARRWTPETYRIVGLDPSRTPAPGEAMTCFPPEARARVQAAMDRARATGERFDLLAPFESYDGRAIWVRLVGSGVAREGARDGRIVRLMGAIQDVTAQAAERDALAAAEERTRMAVNSGGIGIWDWNIETGLIVWDDWMDRLYGISDPSAEFQYQQWCARLHPDDLAPTIRRIEEAVAGARPYDTEYRVRWDDGSWHILRAAGRVIRAPDGMPQRMIGTNWDVTEQRRLSAELARQHELLRVTLDTIVDAVITVDAAGAVAWMNPMAERLTGWPQAEAIGRPIGDIYRIVDAAGRTKLPLLTAECLATGRVATDQRDLALLSRDGAEYRVTGSVAPFRNGRGGVLGAVKTFRDVSAQRRLEAERAEREAQLVATNAELERLARHFNKARAHAEQANRAKTRFLASMSHELRTPLNGILGYAQLLKMDGGLTPAQGARVEAMLSAGTHLLEMISFVLDLSEIETEGLTLQPATFDLITLAEASLNVVRPAAEAKNLALTLAVAPGTKRQVRSDPARLRQILLNLLGNAVKYTPSGAVVLEIGFDPAPDRTTDGATDGGATLWLRVRDTGPGIPPAKRRLLFRAFERLECVGAEGAGLGLSLSRNLAHRLGGDITHEQNPGGGSIFSLRLPTFPAVADETPAAPVRASDFVNATAAPAPSRAEPDAPAELRILVVDDVEMNRDIAAAFIRSAGHRVEVASGGAEAVERAAAGRFDAILMDVRMPDIDGLEATRRIRALPDGTGSAPIVALTAQVFTEQVEACRAAGMDTHVAKPFTLETLLGAIARGIEAAGARAAPTGPTNSGPTSYAPADPAAPTTDDGPPWLNEATFAGTMAMFAPRTLQGFLDTLSQKIGEMRDRLSALPTGSEAGADFAEQAHALAGSAGLFGFERLVSAARRFEREVGADAARAMTLAPELRAALVGSLRAIEEKRSRAGERQEPATGSLRRTARE